MDDKCKQPVQHRKEGRCVCRVEPPESTMERERRLLWEEERNEEYYYLAGLDRACRIGE